MNLILWLGLSDRLTSARGIQGEAKQGKERNERRSLCSMNSPGHGQLSICPLQATGTEQEGPSREPADIRSPSDSSAERCCCGASPLESQGTCSGPTAGSGGGKPRLGAVLPLMVSAGHTHTQVETHTHRQVPRADLDTPLPLRAQTGTEAHCGGQGP